MGGWLVAGVALGAWLVGLCLGALAGAYYTHLHCKAEVATARADVERERTRADVAVDSLARQIRGEPISMAARVADAEAFEAEMRSREDLHEMFQEETDDVPPE